MIDSKYKFYSYDEIKTHNKYLREIYFRILMSIFILLLGFIVLHFHFWKIKDLCDSYDFNNENYKNKCILNEEIL